MGNESAQIGERRPIASRKWKISQRLADYLARKGLSPNAISIAGMLSCMAAGLSLAATSYLPSLERVCWLSAAVLVQLRLTANMLDGMVAIASKRASRLGELYNEVPDRISDMATFIGAGYAVGGNPALGFLAACVALMTAYVRAMGKVAGARQEFCGPMAKQHRMFVITLTAVYCGLTPRDWQPLWGSPPSFGLLSAALAVIVVGGAVTVVRRLVRIARTLRKDAP
jgi:phosphatidylglycerophosphate synthase